MSNYSFADHASSSQSAKFGNYILQPGAGEIRKPTWNGTETIIRILPQWDFEEKRWTPYRTSSESMRFGDWIRRYEAVRGFGENGVTFLLYDPTDRSYDVRSNPCVRLYNNINKSIDNKSCRPDWPAMFKGGTGKRAILSRTQSIYLARVGIFKINSKDMVVDGRAPLGLATADPGYFMELPRTAGEKLVNMLEERKEDYQGDADDYHAAYKYGDVVSLQHGAYISIFEEGTNEEVKPDQASSGPRQLAFTTGGRNGYGSGGGGGQKSFKGYDIRISPTYKGFSAQLNTPQYEALIREKQRPWEDSLRFLSHQEQAFLVQDGFPAEAILYAWKDNPEWIKDETRRKAVGGRTIAMDPRNNGEPVQQQFRPAPKPDVGYGGVYGGPSVAAEQESTPTSVDAVVGGWGDAAWEATTGRDEEVGRDIVLPKASGIDNADTGVVKTEDAEAKRRAAVTQGLEAAKLRASAAKKTEKPV